MYKGTKGENAPHTQTGRGDWALGWWEVGATRDRAVRLGMPGLALPETVRGTGEGFAML